MDKVVEVYERANELVRYGKKEEALSEYKTGLSLLEIPGVPDASTRKLYFAVKLATLLWDLGRHQEARLYFELAGQEVPRIPTNNMPFRSGIKALQELGLLGDLDRKELRRLLNEMGCDADHEIDLIHFLQVYYVAGEAWLSPRAVKDGFLHHDWKFWQETDDVVAEICQLIGQPLMRQIGYHDKPRIDCMEVQTFLTVELYGLVTYFAIDGLADIVAFANEVLEAKGDRRRFVSIETNGDWEAFYLVEPDVFKKIFTGKSPVLTHLGVPGIDEQRWAPM